MFNINKTMRSQVELQVESKITEERGKNVAEAADKLQIEQEMEKVARLVARAKKARQKAEQKRRKVAELRDVHEFK